jgi:tetratricopeptide (TPR) repeat protein
MEAILLESAGRRHSSPESGNAAEADLLSVVGALRYQRGAYVEAEPELRAALAIRQKALGLEHRAVAQTTFSLGVTLWRQGRFAEALPLLRQAVVLDRTTTKTQDVALLWALTHLGRVQAELGDLTGAESSFREAIAIAPKIDEAKNQDRAEALDGLGELLTRSGRFSEAESSLVDADRYALRRCLRFEEFRDPELPRKIAEHLIRLYADWSKVDPGRAAAADPWKRRLPDLLTVEKARKAIFLWPAPPSVAAKTGPTVQAAATQ